MSVRLYSPMKKRMRELFGFLNRMYQAEHQDRILDGGCIQNLFSWTLLCLSTSLRLDAAK